MAIEKPAAPGTVAGVAAMKDGEVHGVDAIFDEVEPVVIVVPDRLDVLLTAAADKRKIVGQRWGIVMNWPQVGEDQAALLPHRIGQMLHLLIELTVLRLRGLFEAIACYIEEPGMVRTANTAGFNFAIFEGAAAVRAMQAHQTDTSVQIAEKYQLLA